MSRQGTPNPTPDPRRQASAATPARAGIPTATAVRPAAGAARPRQAQSAIAETPGRNGELAAMLCAAGGILIFVLMQLIGAFLQAVRDTRIHLFMDEVRKGLFGYPPPPPPDTDIQFWMFAIYSCALWGLGMAIVAAARMSRRKGITTIWPWPIVAAVVVGAAIGALAWHARIWVLVCGTLTPLLIVLLAKTAVARFGVGLELFWGASLAIVGFVLAMSGHSLWWLVLCAAPVALLGLPFVLRGDASARSEPGSVLASPYLASLVIFLGLICAYGTTFVSGMSLDNKYIIGEYYLTAPQQLAPNPIISYPFAKNLFLRDYWWPKGISGLFRPIATFSYWLNFIYRDNRLGTFNYHVVNLALHWLTATFLFLLVRTATKRFVPALVAALIFVTHPITTESVTNIIGRADILAACCVLGALLCYVRASRCARITALAWASGACFVVCGACISWMIYRASFPAVGLPDMAPWQEYFFIGAAIMAGAMGVGCCVVDIMFGGGGKAFWLAGLAAVTMFGVFSKESAVAIVPMVLAWIFVFETDFRRRPLMEDARTVGNSAGLAGLAMLPGIMVMVLARYFVYRTSTPPEEPFLDNPIRGQSFITGRMTAVDVAGRLLSKLVWPVHLSADYSWNQIPLFWWTPGWHNTQAVLWLLFFIAALAATVWLYFRSRPACFFILFYFIGYAPTANIIKVIGAIMAERFMYLPLIGFAGAAGIGIDWLARWLSARANRRASVAVVTSAEPANAGAGLIYWLPYGAVLIVLALFCVRTSLRNYDWADDTSLFTAGVNECPNAFRVYQSLAFSYFEKLRPQQPGAHLSPEDVEAIDKTYETAIKAYPIVSVLPPDKNSSRLYLHLGMYYLRKADSLCTIDSNGRPADNDQSKYYLEQAARYLSEGAVVDQKFNVTNYSREIARGTPPERIHDTGMNFLYTYLGPVLGRLGRVREAVDALVYARRLAPDDPGPLGSLVEVMLNAGKFQEATALSIEMVQLHPEQKQFWPVIHQLLDKLAPDSNTFVGDKLNLANQTVANLTYLAYQDMTWTMFNAKFYVEARALRQIAVEKYKFPADRFPAADELDRLIAIQNPKLDR